LSPTSGQNNRKVASFGTKFNTQFVKHAPAAAPGDSCDAARQTKKETRTTFSTGHPSESASPLHPECVTPRSGGPIEWFVGLSASPRIEKVKM
jgi:hypothetical protein